MGECRNRKSHNKMFGKDHAISMIPFYVQWNSSTYSLKKRYIAIGQICPECNKILLYDRNDFGEYAE